MSAIQILVATIMGLILLSSIGTGIAKRVHIRLSEPLCPKVWDAKKHEWVSGSYHQQEGNDTARTKNCA